jgi:hypothetical protein
MMATPVAHHRLLIDGTDMDLSNIWIHSQDDPYPGGHRYGLWLSEPLASSWLASGCGLFGLSSVLALAQMLGRARESEAAVFVLNTIERVAQEDQGVEIEGECSPHCSTLHCPSCGAIVWVNWLFDYCTRGAGGELTFRCNGCSRASKVALHGKRVSLSSSDGDRVSSCMQAALEHASCDGALTIRLGKLKWTL